MHFPAHGIHFGAALGAGGLPFAVEVGAGGVGALVAQGGAVGVHIRYDIEGSTVEQGAGGGVLVVEQAGEQAFGKPFGHAFAGVLAGDNPDFEVAGGLVADGEQVDVAALRGAADVVDLAQAAALGVAEEVEVLLVGVGLEIGIIHAAGQRGVFDGEHAVFITGGHAEPVAAVVGGGGLIIFPAFGVARLAGVFDADTARLVGRALQAEIKPLAEGGGIVAAQGEADVLAVGAVGYGDGAAVEVAADFGHG